MDIDWKVVQSIALAIAAMSIAIAVLITFIQAMQARASAKAAIAQSQKAFLDALEIVAARTVPETVQDKRGQYQQNAEYTYHLARLDERVGELETRLALRAQTDDPHDTRPIQ